MNWDNKGTTVQEVQCFVTHGFSRLHQLLCGLSTPKKLEILSLVTQKMRNTERSQLCDLPEIILGLSQDNISVSSSQDYSFCFLSSLSCSLEPLRSCQKASCMHTRIRGFLHAFQTSMNQECSLNFIYFLLLPVPLCLFACLDQDFLFSSWSFLSSSVLITQLCLSSVISFPWWWCCFVRVCPDHTSSSLE